MANEIKLSTDISGVESAVTALMASLDKALQDMGDRFASHLISGFQRGVQGAASGLTPFQGTALPFNHFGSTPAPPIPSRPSFDYMSSFSAQDRDAAQYADILHKMKSAGMSIDQYVDKGRPNLVGLQQNIQGTMAQMADPEKRLAIKSEIEKLTEELSLLRKDLKDQKGDERKATEQKISEAQNRLDAANAKYSGDPELIKNLQKLSQNLEALLSSPERSAPVEAPGLGAGRGRWTTAIGAGLGLLGNLPQAIRGYEVASSDIENAMSRTAMSGDLNRAAAMQRLGGQEAITRQAGLEAGLSTFADIGMAAAGTALSFSNPYLAPVAAGLGIKAGSSLLNFKGVEREKMENIIGSEMGRNKEIYAAMQSATDLNVGGFYGARSIGAINASEWLAGYQSPTDVARKYNGMISTPEAVAEHEQAMANVHVDSKYQDRSLVELAGYLGFSQPERQQFQATLAQNGGFFGSKPGWITGMNQEVGDLMTSQAMGFSNAAPVASAMIRGSAQTEEGMRKSLQATKEMWVDLIGAGLDKSSASRAMERMASSVSGLGGASSAEAETRMATAVAQKLFGTKEITGAQMDFSQNITQGMQQLSRSGSGLFGAAGMRTAKQMGDLLKEDGVNIGLNEQVIMSQMGVNDQFLKELGVKDEARRKELIKRYQSMNANNIMDMANVGGSAVAGFGLATALNVKDPYEALKLSQGLKDRTLGTTDLTINKSAEKDLQDDLDRLRGSRGGSQAIALTQIEASKAAGGLGMFTEQIGAAETALRSFVSALNGAIGNRNITERNASEWRSFTQSMSTIPDEHPVAGARER